MKLLLSANRRPLSAPHAPRCVAFVERAGHGGSQAMQEIGSQRSTVIAYPGEGGA